MYQLIMRVWRDPKLSLYLPIEVPRSIIGVKSMPYLLRVVLDMKQLGDNQINIHFIECYAHVSKFLK